MEFQKITIEATVNTDIEKAWKSYTLPEHITQWNFADDSWHCPSAENDLSVGGKMKARLEAKDGSFGFDFEGTYDEVKDKERIVYHLEDGRSVEVIFQDLSEITKVTILFDAETENPIEMQQAGWQAILNNYKKYTEQY